MFCNQTISVFVFIRQRISALTMQQILCSEQDMEVLVLPPDHLGNMQTISNFRPDVVITDTASCDKATASELTQIKESGTTKFLFVCSSAADEASRVLAIGADGLIGSSANAEMLAQAVRSLAGGNVWIDEKYWRHHLQGAATSGKFETEMKDSADSSDIASTRLSYREIEVLKHAAEGFSNRDIAKAMNLSHDTIKCCMWLIVRKLRAKGRVHAVSVARQCGIFS